MGKTGFEKFIEKHGLSPVEVAEIHRPRETTRSSGHEDQRILTINEYLPYTIDAAATVFTLKNMGVEDFDIPEILAKGSGDIWHRIYNPETSERYIIQCAHLKLTLDGDQKVGFLLDGKTIKDYFSELESATEKIREISLMDCTESGIAQENIRLKEMLDRILDRNKTLERLVKKQEKDGYDL